MSGLLKAFDIAIHPSKRDIYYVILCVKALSFSLKIILLKTVVCHSKHNENGSHGSSQNSY